MPNFDPQLLTDKNKLASIFKWLIDKGMTNEQANRTLAEIKNTIFENLKSQHIEPDYIKMLNGISL